eukprot:Rhum_TRINITY_DN14896_c0_g1::Rhum_TRINITY_DN14896_c0_g1_i2::g.125086::m.125086
MRRGTMHPLTLLAALTAASLLSTPCAAQQCPNLVEKLLSTYDSLKAPNNADPSLGPLEVKVTGTITKVNELSTKQQTFKLNMYFRQQWVDPRLAWNPEDFCNTTLIPDLPSHQLWVPDSFFADSNEIHSPDSEEYVRITNDGGVLWSKRIVLNLFCSMDFVWYPFDEQNCQSTIESYAYGPDTMKYVIPLETDRFSKSIEFLNDNPRVGTVASYVLDVPTSKVGVRTIGNNSFSSVEFVWMFRRKKGRFIVTAMSQLWLVVAMSFMGCFVSVDAAPARVAISLISVLTCINILSRLTADVPVVPYITAMDVMYLITIVFVVSNVAEYCGANYMLTLVGRKAAKMADLKRRRNPRFQPSSRPGTEHDLTRCKAELRELFDLFDTGNEGIITRNECRSLVMSAADDRGRVVDEALLDGFIHELPDNVTFRCLVDLLAGQNELADKVGMRYESRSSTLFWGFAAVRLDVERMESVYRIFAPVLYIYANLVWFLHVLSRGDTALTLGVGVPLMAVYLAALAVAAKVAFSTTRLTSAQQLHRAATRVSQSAAQRLDNAKHAAATPASNGSGLDRNGGLKVEGPVHGFVAFSTAAENNGSPLLVSPDCPISLIQREMRKPR